MCEDKIGRTIFRFSFTCGIDSWIDSVPSYFSLAFAFDIMGRIYTITEESSPENLQNPTDISKNNAVHEYSASKPNKFQKPKEIQKYLTSPHEQVGAIEKLTTQHESSQWIVSFLSLFRLILIVPNGLEFDSLRGEFFVKKPNLLIIRIFSYIWLLCLISYSALLWFTGLSQPYTIQFLIGQVTWGCYTLFDITAIGCLRRNGEPIAKLLTDGNKLWNVLDQTKGLGANKKRNCGKYIIRLICGLTLSYTAILVIVVISQLTASSTKLYEAYLDLTYRPNTIGDNQTNLYSYPCTSKKQVMCNLIERSTSSFYAFALSIFWFFMAFSGELIWIAYLLVTVCWGFYFKKMFSDCIQLIENGKLEMLDGIRIYSKITGLLEDYNLIFDRTLLWIVLASIFSTAAMLGELMTGVNNGIVFDSINILALLPFIATIYIGSELNKVGQTLPNIIRKRFLSMGVEEHKNTLELMHGTSLIQYDNVLNNVGLKGAGFFTISYAFVGSMIGVMITYSLVTVQLKLDANK